MIISKSSSISYLDKYYLLNIFRKKEIDVFSTVLAMREQRMKMVQKPEQYLYIFKCLRDEIRRAMAVGDYYYDV